MLNRKNALFLACALALAACTPDSAQDAAQNAESPIASASSQTQTPIYPTRTIAVDFGEIEEGGHTAVARGSVIVPELPDAAKPVPLIIINHLRAPNCSDGAFAYPCAAGASELRYDEGMVYLGETLAKQGYAVVIPDLGRVYIGDDVNEPYNQARLWQKSAERFLAALKSPDATLGKLPAVDFGRVGLLVHSRSALLVNHAHAWLGGALQGVLAYGPAYDTFDLEMISDKPADVPYLALVGGADADVGASANLWLGHYADAKREQPALAATVPGLGHMLINRAAAHMDERIGCDERACPDAKAHENVLSEVATDWFAATLNPENAANSRLPLARQTLPDTLAKQPVHWLALTPKHRLHLGADAFVADGKPVTPCTHSDPMNPVPNPNACPEPALGVVQILTPVAHISKASAAVNTSAQGLALHLSPTASREGVAGTAVKLTLTMQNGEAHHIDIPATHPALASRLSKHENGIYHLGTVRIELPPHIAKDIIKTIDITAEHPVEVKGVDFW